MLKYLYLQIKRTRRILLYMVLCTILLVGLLLGAYSAITDSSISDDTQAKLNIAMCGDVEHPLIQMGITALRAVDNTRFSMNFLIMDESEALSALESREIDAYVVIPDAFMQGALKGDLQKLKYVSSAGTVGVSTLFKDEITRAVSAIVSACQSGMLAFDTLTSQYPVISLEGIAFSPLALTYVEYILIRGNVYTVEDMGITDPLGMDGYLISGLSVLLLGLLMVPYGGLYIKKDNSLERILHTKGIKVHHQVMGEYFSCFFSMVVLMMTAVLVIYGINTIGLFQIREMFPAFSAGGIWLLVLLTMLICAFLYFLFSFSENLVSGLLLTFFGHIALSFVSGCMYPLYFFPESIQRIAGYLPHSYGRLLISDILTGRYDLMHILPVLLYTLCFLAWSVLLHRRHISGGRGYWR